MAKQDFPDIIADIEVGRLVKDVLTRPGLQKLFRDYVEKAGGIALEIERQVVPQADDQEMLHAAGNTVLRLFRIDQKLLGELLTKTGYSKEQRNDIVKTCDLTLKALGQSVQFVFRGHQTHTPLLQEPDVRAIVHANMAPRLHSESTQRAFINYLQHEGFPSIVLERMARLSLYQEFNFSEDLARNKPLSAIYDAFVKNGKLPKDKIVQAAKCIEDGILERMRANHLVVVHDAKGYDLAKSTVLKKADIASLYARSPSHYLDAYTVQDNVLYTAGVTANSDLESNQLGTLTAARAIRHGLLRGTLHDVQDYEVRAYSNTEVYTNQEIQVALNHLVGTNAIDASQRQALVDLPLHQEMLKLLAHTTPDEYALYAPHIRIGLYGDSHGPLTPKSADIQILLSVEQLRSAADTLGKLCAVNPSLDNMLTPVGALSVQLSEAYRYARALSPGHPDAHDIDGQLDSVGATIDDMYDVLNSAGSKLAPKVMATSPSVDTVMRRRNRLDATYRDLENALATNLPTQAAGLLDNKTYSTVSGKTAPSQVTSILTGRYGARVTPAMVRDALIQRIDVMETMAEKGTLRKDSFVQLKQGMKKIINMPAMMQPVYNHIVNAAPQVAERISAWDGRGAGIENQVKRAVKKEQAQQQLGLVDPGFSM